MAKVIKKEVEKASEGLVKVRALLNLQGQYLLPYDAGQEFEINALQAQEIVDAKYAEYIK